MPFRFPPFNTTGIFHYTALFDRISGVLKILERETCSIIKSVKLLLLLWLAAAIPAQPEPAPVLLFFPPPGAPAGAYRALLQSLSGYLVITVKPRSSVAEWRHAATLPASEQLAFERREVEKWVEDGLRALRKHGAKTAGVFGHGAGGLAAAAACQISSSFRACLNLDGEAMGSPFLLEASFDQPFLWLRPLRDPALAPTDAELKDRGMTRADYDLAMSKSGPSAMWKARRMATLVTLYAKDADYESFTSARAGTRSFTLGRTVMLAFFDEHLKGRRSALFAGFATGYPEVVFQQFVTTAVQAPGP